MEAIFFMASHAELAAKLLRDAASFFQSVGEQNPDLHDQLTQNADVFLQIADRVEVDPLGQFDPNQIKTSSD